MAEALLALAYASFGVQTARWFRSFVGWLVSVPYRSALCFTRTHCFEGLLFSQIGRTIIGYVGIYFTLLAMGWDGVKL